MKDEPEDKFIAMVSAKAASDLRLTDFAPRASLVVPAHDVARAKYPAIDFHNHLDAQEPREVLRVMDACNVERCVNITMRVGDEAVCVVKATNVIVEVPARKEPNA